MSLTHIPAELRRQVRARARLRCEFCLIPESFAVVSHEVDHVVAEKHDGQTTLENLALACRFCNMHKGTDLTSIDPETKLITPLFNPRRDLWADHFALDGGHLRARTAFGRVTIKLLHLNTIDLVNFRGILAAGGVDLTPPA